MKVPEGVDPENARMGSKKEFLPHGVPLLEVGLSGRMNGWVIKVSQLLTTLPSLFSASETMEQ